MSMGKQYVHLSLAERDQITQLLWEGKKSRDIAVMIGRDKSTIYRELKLNSSPEHKKYLSHRAHQRAENRREEASCRKRLKDDLIRGYVEDKLQIGWSPELISGRIKIEHPGQSISYEAIYQYIYHAETTNRGELIEYLRRSHRKRKKKGIGRKERRTKIPNRIPIDERPKSVEKRQEFGHWEGDSIVSRKSLAALNSLTERKSRLLLLTKLDRKGAIETKNAVVRRLQVFHSKGRRTLTMDNGTENAQHQEITASLDTKCFFAHPYASWERGTNEHINGMIRWYLPKGTDFSKISDKQIAKIESLLNNRPMKCLGFKTPIEVASSFVALQG